MTYKMGQDHRLKSMARPSHLFSFHLNISSGSESKPTKHVGLFLFTKILHLSQVLHVLVELFDF